MRNVIHRNSTHAGFSLLEVLIAVVVLSVGLLALAALQGSLTRASAEAKVRGRVAAMLTARMDGMRHGGYGTLAPEGLAPAVVSTEGQALSDCDPASPDAQDWLDCARIQANLGMLSATQRIDTWQGAATFTQSVAPNANVPQFRRVTLGATWTDAEGQTRSMQLVSDVSSMSLTNNIVVPPDPATTGGGGPIVRTIDPATAGIVPIAVSTQSTSATSNPVPELVGRRNNQEVVGTRFSVLNYTPPSSPGSDVVMQKRFDNEVIKCSCRYGAGGNNLPVIYRTAQWPAIWTGERYDVHVPDSPTAAPGQQWNSGPAPNAQQSPLCQECCRDHHDNPNSTAVRFDPERSDGAVTKFDNSNGALVAVENTVNGTYVDACRMIRIDGFWRTAADLYQRQYGLLETTPVNNELAKNGAPTDAAAQRYEDFVIGFLDDYDGTSATPHTNAQAAFVADTGFDVPALVTIPNPSNSDYRYLHARGLYVDYLEEDARNKLIEVLEDTDERGLCPEGTDVAECVMPYLPFTTANLTEIASWATNNNAVLTVNTGNLLATNPEQPSGGRTIGKTAGTANSTSTMRRSNSGIAISSVFTTLGGVDPADASNTHNDLQPFQVGGAAGGPAFDVGVIGGGGNPFVFFTLGTDVGRECLRPAGINHHCVTSPGTTLPQSGSIELSNYWIEDTTSMLVSASCNGTTASATLNVPTFHNYQVVSAEIGGIAGTIGAPVNDGRTDEATTVVFPAIAQGAFLSLVLAEQVGSPTHGVITSCTTNGDGNEINNPVWHLPWVPTPDGTTTP